MKHMLPLRSFNAARLFLTSLLCFILTMGTAGTLLSQVITVTSPNGGESLSACSTHPITFTYTGVVVPMFNIDYSADNGANWIAVATGVVGTGSPAGSGVYNWSVANVTTAAALVRVTLQSNPANFDQSDAVFSIAAGLTINTPNGGESWTHGTTQMITWTATGTSSTVTLDYSTDNGATWNVISLSEPLLAGTYSWMVPNTPSTQCLVRIADNNNFACMVDSSNAVFTIIGTIGIEPNAGKSGTGMLHGYPNPFHNETSIRFELTEIQSVNLEITNLNGQRVIEIKGMYEQGVQEIRWNGKDENGSEIPPGIYFARLTAGNSASTVKLIFPGR